MRDRIALLPGDHHRVRLKREYDVILISHILHSNGPEACKTLLGRLSRALRKAFPGPGWASRATPKPMQYSP